MAIAMHSLIDITIIRYNRNKIINIAIAIKCCN